MVQIKIRVAGVTAPAGSGVNRQDYLRGLAQEVMEGRPAPTLYLEREPENKYDKHAVKVYAPTQFDRIWTNFQQIGYLPARVCPSCWSFVSVVDRKNDKCCMCGGDIKLPWSFFSSQIATLIDNGIEVRAIFNQIPVSPSAQASIGLELTVEYDQDDVDAAQRKVESETQTNKTGNTQ